MATCSSVIPAVIRYDNGQLVMDRVSCHQDGNEEAPARVEFSDTSSTFKEISVIIGLIVLCQDAGYIVHRKASVNFAVNHHDGEQVRRHRHIGRIQGEFAICCTFTVGDAQQFFQFA